MKLSPVVACIALLVGSLAGCGTQPDPTPGLALSVAPWALPAEAGAALPDFSRTPDGGLLLSWVQKQGDAQRLLSARFRADRWSAPAEIARADYFGSSVDVPHVRVTPDRAMWAQWLRKSPAGGHALDVVLSRSGDGGATWSAPVLVNLDGTPTEHGFVATWAEGASGLGLAWLDGRATQPMQHGAGGHQASGAGATMVRAAIFDSTLERRQESEIDSSSCDCCQMDATSTSRGPLLAFRDRTHGEVRDVAVTALERGRWSAPRAVHDDRWVMSACPVNGPAIAASGDAVAVAWYTGAGRAPSVRLAISGDAGASFAAPVELARGAAVLGNVDVAIDERAVWLAWLSESASGQSLRLARVDRASGRVDQLEVAKLKARGRGAGLPKLLLDAGKAYLVWTDANASTPALHGAVIASSDAG